VPWVETPAVSGRDGVRNETFHLNVSTKTKPADLKIRACIFAIDEREHHSMGGGGFGKAVPR